VTQQRRIECVDSVKVMEGNLLFIALILLVKQGINSVHIVQIEGPEVVKAGAELRLDCDYDYMAEEQPQLDLKWYFNGSPIPVYQWVPSMKKGPQVIGEMFRESLDLGYVAHNDTYKRHRALRLAQADHRFSGTYQCKVSSFLDEDFQQKEVLVYTPPSSIRIVPGPPGATHSDDKYLNVSCAVTGVHPTPIIDLSWTNNASSEHMERLDTVVRTQPSGLLDVTVSSVLPREVFTADLVIACEVSIPNTPHYTREELTTFTQSMLTSRYTSGGKGLKSSELFTISSLLITFWTLLQ